MDKRGNQQLVFVSELTTKGTKHLLDLYNRHNKGILWGYSRASVCVSLREGISQTDNGVITKRVFALKGSSVLLKFLESLTLQVVRFSLFFRTSWDSLQFQGRKSLESLERKDTFGKTPFPKYPPSPIPRLAGLGNPRVQPFDTHTKRLGGGKTDGRDAEEINEARSLSGQQCANTGNTHCANRLALQGPQPRTNDDGNV